MTRRHVSIHLTPFAPGVAEAAIGDRRRWIAQWSVTPAQSIGDLLSRLQRAPGALGVRVAGGEVEVVGRISDFPEPQPLAVIADGLTAQEVRDALQAHANGVRQRVAA